MSLDDRLTGHQSDAPLIIQPFLHLLTLSELHAVMTGGYATISGSSKTSHLHKSGHITLLSAGSVLAAYINFGISASHLLSASVMSAPAALAYSKLFYPETEESRTKVDHIVTDERYLKVEFNFKFHLIKFWIKEWHFFSNGRR